MTGTTAAPVSALAYPRIVFFRNHEDRNSLREVKTDLAMITRMGLIGYEIHGIELPGVIDSDGIERHRVWYTGRELGIMSNAVAIDSIQANQPSRSNATGNFYYPSDFEEEDPSDFEDNLD